MENNQDYIGKNIVDKENNSMVAGSYWVTNVSGSLRIQPFEPQNCTNVEHVSKPRNYGTYGTPVVYFRYEDSTCIPTKANSDAVGYDVIAWEVNETDDYIEYDLGFRTQIPAGWFGEIRPRSSISKYDLIMCNSPAVIDPDYRGNWKVRFKRLGDKVYQKGDRVAQILFRKSYEIFHSTAENELTETNRGVGGFGSTGL
jgi:deoxyuridine 5'-triphosphate nucleotidohydrolase